jgi:hypothetical protein
VDDVRAIEGLIFTYAERLDAGDLDGVADLFADGGFGGPGDTPLARGRQAVLDVLSSTVRIHPDGTPRTAHITTNVMVETSQRSATARSRFTVLQAVGGLLQPIIVGRYQDRFAQLEGLWRFQERRVVTDLVGDLSQHLLVDPSRLGLREP